MMEKLRASLLDAVHVKTLKFTPMTEDLALSAGVNPPWAGFKIPYFTPEGKVIPDFYRYRFWPESKPSKGWKAIAEPSSLRYVQPSGSELHVYMPPLLKNGFTWREVMEHPTIALFITEGELKAASACINTTANTLGLGGVFSWMNKRRGQALIPILEAFVWKTRLVYLVFDSDQNSKPLVQLAASRLALALTARGAVVYEVALPQPADGSKMGIDDFLVRYGPAAFDELVADEKSTTPVEASKELHRLNDEVAVIWGGGPVGNIIRFEDGRIITPTQFTRSLYSERTYTEVTVKKDGGLGSMRVHKAAEDWLSWPARAKIRGVTYLPGSPSITDDGDFNLWRGGGVEPKAGSLKQFDDLLAKMFSGIDHRHLLWFKRWLAYPIRFPGTKLYSCVFLWSHAGGTGKNLLGEIAAPLSGQSNVTVINSRHLASDFNGWAEAKQFVIGDEITLDANKKSMSGDLKSMLTSRTVRINHKGIESYEIPDFCNYLLTSNEPVGITLDQDERRTFVWHVNETPVGDAYGRAFMKWLHGYTGPPYNKPPLAGSGAAALAHYFTEELDMGDFSPTAPPPDTASKLELIANSRSEIDTWAAALRLEPERYLVTGDYARYAAGGGSGGSRGLYSVYEPQELLKLYDPDGRQRVGLRALGIALDRAGFRKATGNNARLGNVRSTFWLIGETPEERKRSPLTSTEAARRYVAERPEKFKPPSARGTEKRVQ